MAFKACTVAISLSIAYRLSIIGPYRAALLRQATPKYWTLGFDSMRELEYFPGAIGLSLINARARDL